MLPLAIASRRARTVAKKWSISSVHMWRTAKRRGQSRIKWLGLPHRWQVCGVLVFARWASMSIGMPGCSGAVGRKGGGAEVCAGLTYWVGADVRGNAEAVRPSGACGAGDDCFGRRSVNRLVGQPIQVETAGCFVPAVGVIVRRPVCARFRNPVLCGGIETSAKLDYDRQGIGVA